MRRAVILSTLTLLLLAVTGITLARESALGPERDSLTESTVQDTTTTTGEPTATTVEESTNTTDAGHSQRTEPAPGSLTQDSAEPETDEPEVTEDEATEAEGKNVGKVKDDEGEANGGGGKKVTLCHKGKNSIAVGKPAQAAHVRHSDTVGPCQPEGAKPEPLDETPGPEAAQNGDGGGSNGQQKVTLCHKGKTLTVGAPAREAHLRHGDTEGPCAGQ